LAFAGMLQVVNETETVVTQIAQREGEDQRAQRHTEGEIEVEKLEPPLTGGFEHSGPGTEEEKAEDRDGQYKTTGLRQDHFYGPEV
jgi:hypothetical protein